MYDPLKSKTKVVAYAAIAFLFGVGIASGFGWTANSQAMPITSEVPQLPESAVKPALDLSDAFVNVAEHVTPAVVRIETERVAQVASRQGGNPLEQFFFERPGQPQQEQPQERRLQAGGSGFIISADGYVLTNEHVVGNAESIRVFLSDGRIFDAEIVGSDRTTDVAVIKILDGDADFPSLSFGDSDALKVGEWILAVGNPGFGGGTSLEYSVTAGIVSAKGRGLQLIANGLRGDPVLSSEGTTFAIEDFIQTDAVINPGNSGGPMVNLRGQVVGINSAIASQTGYYQGYGFAIPIDLAERVSEDLIAYGEIRRAWIGVQMRSIDALDAEKFGLPRIGGALISGITEGSPAASSGIRVEDVITGVDGQPIMRSAQLQQVIARKRPGDRVTLEVYRNQRARTIELQLDEAPINEAPVVAAVEEAADEATVERLGINVRPLTEELNANLNYAEAKGVIIWEVEPYSPAQRRGLVRGQRIARIDGEEINTVEDVSRALADVEPGQIVTFVMDTPGGGSQVSNVRVPR